MKHRWLMALGLCVLVVPAERMINVAAQEPKDPIIGTWIFNTAKSTYVSGTRKKPTSITRTFDYTRDGLILVTHQTVPSDGNISALNHWYMSLDGKEHPEFSRARGAEAYMWLSITPVDRYTKELVGKGIEGGVKKVTIMLTFSVSKDRKIMSMTYKDANGKPTGDVAVYDRKPDQ